MVAILERDSTFRGAEIARITVTIRFVDEAFVIGICCPLLMVMLLLMLLLMVMLLVLLLLLLVLEWRRLLYLWGLRRLRLSLRLHLLLLLLLHLHVQGQHGGHGGWRVLHSVCAISLLHCVY